ncbi:unnamed protein product [Linum trigynum]|uniref:Uncharacterized protein n=1 Tax=Linum trigynum TaxID=586398 RepID=A0AAV2FSX1_9ROSI
MRDTRRQATTSLEFGKVCLCLVSCPWLEESSSRDEREEMKGLNLARLGPRHLLHSPPPPPLSSPFFSPSGAAAVAGFFFSPDGQQQPDFLLLTRRPAAAARLPSV